jgi:hypothetical protein
MAFLEDIVKEVKHAIGIDDDASKDKDKNKGTGSDSGTGTGNNNGGGTHEGGAAHTTDTTHTVQPGDHIAGHEDDGEQSAWAASAGNIWTDSQNLSFWNQSKDGQSDLLPGLSVTDTADDVEAKHNSIFAKYWSKDTTTTYDPTWTQLSKYEQSTDKGDQMEPTGEDADGTKHFKNKNGNEVEIGKDHTRHKDKTADTWVDQKQIDVKEKDTHIHVDKEKHTVDYEGPGGQKFHMVDNGDGTYTDDKGNRLRIDHYHHSLNLHLADGTQMRVFGDHINVKHPGSAWVSIDRTDSGSTGTHDATRPDAGTVSSTQKDGKRWLHVGSKDGRATADVGQHGERVVHVYDAQGHEIQQIYSKAGSDQMYIADGQGNMEYRLYRDGDKWKAQKLDADGNPVADVDASQVVINGKRLDANSATLQVTSDMSVGANGQVSSTSSDGQQLTTAGSGAQVNTHDNNNGTDGTITGDGKKTKVTTTDTNGDTQTTETDGKGFKHHHHCHGQQGEQSDVDYTPGENGKPGTLHMGPPGKDGVDFQFGDDPQGGMEWKGTRLWNGDQVDPNGTVHRNNGDTINPDGSMSFSDGTYVDSYGNVSQDGHYMGTADGGTWSGGGENGAVGRAQAAIAQAAAVAGEIRSMIAAGHISSGDIGRLLDLYSQLGGLKAELIASGANLEAAAVAGQVDSEQSDVSGALTAAQIATFEQETAKSFTAAGASPDILAALQQAGAGTDVASILKVLEQKGVLEHPRVDRPPTNDQSQPAGQQ